MNIELTGREGLWTLAKKCVAMWWSLRSTPAKNQAHQLFPSESPSPRTSPPIGWRAWLAKPNESGEYVLHSVTVDYVWTGPVVNNGVAPNASPWLYAWPVKTVGFHATRERGDANGYAQFSTGRSVPIIAERPPRGRELLEWHCVMGQVECSGAVVEYDKGWRCERQAIQRLIVFTTDPKLRRDLEARYQCDVTVEPAA